MAVAFDAVGPSSSGAGGTSISSLSWTHANVASGVKLLIGCSLDNASDAGITMTAKVDTVLQSSVAGPVESDSQAAGYVQAWNADGLASGNRTVLITASSAVADLEGGSVSFTGAASGNPAAVTASGTSLTASATVTGTAASSLVFGFAASGDSITATTSPATSRFVNNLQGGAGNATGNCAGSTSAGGGSVTMAWTLTASADPWAVIAAEVQAAAPGTVLPHAGGTTWRRLFRHRQLLLPSPPPAAAPQAGPPFYLPGHPLQAKGAPQRGGRTAGRGGVYAQPGPPVKALSGPVKAQPAVPVRTGRAAGRAGLYAQAGPAVRALAEAVTARLRVLSPRGRTSGRTGTYAQPGPPVYPLGHPVQARRLPQRGGSAQSRSGTFAGVVITSGPPVYPLGHPVQARRLPQRGGSSGGRRGAYAGTGALFWSLRRPAGLGRQQPPPPAKGRTAAQRGPYASTGSPAIPLRRPVRGQPQKPLLTGRAGWRAGTYTVPFIPPFTIGVLTAADKASGVLAAAGASSALTAATAPSGTLTAADQRTGGPS